MNNIEFLTNDLIMINGVTYNKDKYITQLMNTYSDNRNHLVVAPNDYIKNECMLNMNMCKNRILELITR